MLKTSVADVLLGTNATRGLTATVQNTTAAGQKDLTNSFASTLNSTADKSVEVEEKQTSDVKQGKMVVENKPVRDVSEAKEQPKKDALENEAELSAAKEIVEDGKVIIEKVKSEFDVTDEAVEEAMEVLGLSLQDLFNPAELQNLIMEVTGTTDSIELITNDSLYKGIGEVMNLMNELKGEVIKEFNITDEAFGKLTDDAKIFENLVSEEADTRADIETLTVNSMEEGTLVENKETAEVVTEKPEEKSEESIPVEITFDNTKVENTEVTDNEVEAVVEKQPEMLTEKSVKAEKTETDEKEIKVEVNVEKTETVANTETAVKTPTESNTKNDHQEKKENSSDNNEQIASPVTQFTTTTNTVGDVVEVVESYRNVAGGQEIMRQVTEYMKVNISENSTSMEMQLHPASLGTVNMQVISNNGQVTAHFTVQNEAVKAVLETQLLTLQETLNEQGTKVSAIEVTVAGYNLDKGSENQSNENSSNNHRKGFGKRSTIDLNSLDSLDDLDEEEVLEAKVMEMEGNTVSYTV